jgi:hypothetical protein
MADEQATSDMDLARWLDLIEHLRNEDNPPDFDTIWNTTLKFYKAAGHRGLNLLTGVVYGAISRIDNNSSTQANLLNFIKVYGAQIRTAAEIHVTYWLFDQAGEAFSADKAGINPANLESPEAVSLIQHYYSVDILTAVLDLGKTTYTRLNELLLGIQPELTDVRLLLQVYRRLYVLGDLSVIQGLLEKAFLQMAVFTSEKNIADFFISNQEYIINRWLLDQVWDFFGADSEHRARLNAALLAKNKHYESDTTARQEMVEAIEKSVPKQPTT